MYSNTSPAPVMTNLSGPERGASLPGSVRATVRLKVWLQPLPISEERVLFSRVV